MVIAADEQSAPRMGPYHPRVRVSQARAGGPNPGPHSSKGELYMVSLKSSKGAAFSQKEIKRRGQLWSGLNPDALWNRKIQHGFTTVPRNMGLMMTIIDDLTKGRPASLTYFELWCRAKDEMFTSLAHKESIAFHSGFTGQRAVRTWTERMKLLQKLGFIDIKPGASGALTYALIWNPYHVIQRLWEQKAPGLTESKYNALIDRSGEIGADDWLEGDLPPLYITELDAEK